MSSTIQKLMLKKLGIFRNCTIPQKHQLLKYDLIYGFNGSGKTTLSRVFGSLEHGVVRAGLPRGGMFDVQLSNGSILQSTNDYNALKNRLLVFNVDFIEDNFRWKEGTANPVFFYLGRKQVELADQLESVIQQKIQTEGEKAIAQADYDGKDKSFGDFKRITAQSISKNLLLSGRNYEAPRLSDDYRTTYGEAHLLSEDEIQIACEEITQREPFSEVELLDNLGLNTWELVIKVQSILGTTIGDIVVEDLRSHESMLSWVRK